MKTSELGLLHDSANIKITTFSLTIKYPPSTMQCQSYPRQLRSQKQQGKLPGPECHSSAAALFAVGKLTHSNLGTVFKRNTKFYLSYPNYVCISKAFYYFKIQRHWDFPEKFFNKGLLM